MQELGAETKIEKKKKEGSRSGWWVIVLNIAVIAVIAFFEFGRGERPQRIAMHELRPLFLLAALGCFLIMLLSETWKYARLLYATDHARPLHTGFRCAILGKYFDNVTPAGFGGQPFQIHYLRTQGCTAGTSGALPILGFLGLQFSFIAVALLVFLFSGRVYLDLLTLRLAAWVGLACYSFVPVCVVLFAIAPKPLARIVGGGTRLLHRVHIIKDPERSTRHAIEALESYTDSVRHFSSQPRLLAVTVILSLIFRLAMVAMPWFVLRAFGARVSFMRCFCQVTYIYAVIAMIPTPGNSGAAEASFYTVFSALSTGSVFWAMLVWRLLCYYSWLIGGACHFIGKTRSAKRKADP